MVELGAESGREANEEVGEEGVGEGGLDILGAKVMLL